MKAPTVVQAVCLFATFSLAHVENSTNAHISKQSLPTNFKPPQVFKNVNLVRTINLDKGYARETINVVIENIDSKPHDEYYIPFESSVIARVGGFEARDKKDVSKGLLQSESVGYDTDSNFQFYRIRLHEPLAPSIQQTLSISYSLLSSLRPLPATIGQADKQYLQYQFGSYAPSAYKTAKQKTKIKFPSTDVPDYHSGPNDEGKEDPQKQGSTYTYGPYNDVEAGATDTVHARYEFTKPVLHATLLERDIEVSHWGGNLAIEERYWLENRGAALSKQFSRFAWQASSYYSPKTSALKALTIPLAAGATDAYFIDDIGNVTTSHFRSNSREAKLELEPRYPVFGAWKYKFKIGWNQNLKATLRHLANADEYILKVPMLEGPQQVEGIAYDKVVVRVILPEGSNLLKYDTDVALVGVKTSLHRSYMDTVGRTTLTLTAINVVDDLRGRDLIITYEYSFLASLRKPITILIAVFGVFAGVWFLGSLDTSIGRKA